MTIGYALNIPESMEFVIKFRRINPISQPIVIQQGLKHSYIRVNYNMQRSLWNMHAINRRPQRSLDFVCSWFLPIMFLSICSYDYYFLRFQSHNQYCLIIFSPLSSEEWIVFFSWSLGFPIIIFKYIIPSALFRCVVFNIHKLFIESLICQNSKENCNKDIILENKKSLICSQEFQK